MNTNSDSEILQGWYQFAAQQPGSVESLLQLLRNRQGKSSDRQRTEFGATSQMFDKLRSMRLPREQFFAQDAKRIAEACYLSNPTAFVQALILARNIQQSEQFQAASTSYMAAFDDNDNLDEIPTEE
ncbi:MAG: hypothetical protein H6672_13220 [Anaerolineaceae bacterium]|nr:hypothetical protein [Anaerolineaceae bacterium]